MDDKLSGERGQGCKTCHPLYNLSFEVKFYPRDNSKHSCGFAAGMRELAVKLPSMNTLAFPSRNIKSEVFVIFAFNQIQLKNT